MLRSRPFKGAGPVPNKGVETSQRCTKYGIARMGFHPMSQFRIASRFFVSSTALALGGLSLMATGCGERDRNNADALGIEGQDGGQAGTTGAAASSTNPLNPSGATATGGQDSSAAPGNAQIQQLIAGASSSCAALSDGSLRCWGDNQYGQLHAGHTRNLGVAPQDMGMGLGVLRMPNAATVTKLSVGTSMCASASDNALYCWGHNSDGQLGLGHRKPVGADPLDIKIALTPVDLGANSPVRDHCVGQTHACAIVGDGKVKCWGNNIFGQLGLGHTTGKGVSRDDMGDALPFVDLGAEQAKQISCGAQHTCVLTNSQKVLCWGKNNGGQLGTASTQDIGKTPESMGAALVALPFTESMKIAQLASNKDHNCVLTEAGTVHCWGANAMGQLGLGHKDPVGTQPGQLSSIIKGIDLGTTSPVTQIALGQEHTCALTQDGQVRCWGANALGQLGAGPVPALGISPEQMGAALAPVALGDGFVATSISAGDRHTCAKDMQGAVRCWGFNYQGQLGLGDQLDRGTQAAQMGNNLPLVNVMP